MQTLMQTLIERAVTSNYGYSKDLDPKSKDHIERIFYEKFYGDKADIFMKKPLNANVDNIPERYRTLRQDWKRIAKKYVGSFSHLKSKQSKSMDRLQFSILGSPKPADDDAHIGPGKLNKLGRYEIVVNVKGDLHDQNFYLDYVREGGFKMPIRVSFGSEIPFSRANLEDLLNIVGEDYRGYIGKYTESFIYDILQVCDAYIGDEMQKRRD